MDPQENADSQVEWDQETEFVFYEPRTIPAGWDLSEYLPVYHQAGKVSHFDFSEDQPLA